MRRSLCLIAVASSLACLDATTHPVASGERPRAATPTFSPPGSTYAAAQSVTIASDTPDAVVHCTRDGTEPTRASPVCADPVAVTSTTTLRAVATADGSLDSDVATGIFTIDPGASPAAAPTFSPDPGVTYTASVNVTIRSTTGATIHCTRDGSPATAESPTCTSPLSITATTTLRAVATAPGHTVSPESQATYRIQGTLPQAARPTFSPAAGTFTTPQSVHVTSTTGGTTLHCTTDGTPATAASPTCPDPVPVTSSTTLRAIATATGYVTSAEATGTFTLRVATPTFSPPGGAYGTSQSVHVSTTTPGATLRCTTNGADPTAASPVCADPIAVSSTAGAATIKAIATAPGWSSSVVGSATYTFPGGAEPSELDCLVALSTKRQVFGHQSVGNQIFYGTISGTSGTTGLKGLVTANPTAGVTIVGSPASLAAIPAGGWAERANGTNGNPMGKIDAFRDSLAPTFQGADYLGFKFCFVDFGGSTDVTSIWNHYRDVMDTLEANPAYQGRLIYVTVPLYAASVGDVGGNTKRNEMSQHIRDTYGSTGRVFDLAWFESHLADGTACTISNGTVPAMCNGFSNGSGDAGHLGSAGVTRLSHEYLMFMCKVIGRY